MSPHGGARRSPANWRSEQNPHPLFINYHCLLLKDDRDGPADPIPQDRIPGQLDRVINKLGGSLEAVEKQLAWQYYLHVGPKAFMDGFLAGIEALQGARNTYFAGSMLSFETVEEAFAYSRKLVGRFF